MNTLIKVAHMQEGIEISSMKLKVSPYSFLSVRADFENLVMAQAFELHAKVAREITP